MDAPGLEMTSEELAHFYAKLGQGFPIITIGLGHVMQG